MKGDIIGLVGAQIESATLTTEEDVEGEFSGDINAFRLEIVTDKGVCVFEGCHDELLEPYMPKE